MKAFIVSFVILFFTQFAHAQSAVSDFTLSADKNFTFKMVSPGDIQEIKGTFQNGDVHKISDGAHSVYVKSMEKFIFITSVKNNPRTGTGQLFIIEEMNSLFVPLTLAPITGNAATLTEDSLRMIEIARIASGGDLAAGVHKVIEAFRQNPRLTIQIHLSKLATRPAKIGVGERNRIQRVRSFEELERGSGDTSTKPRTAPVKRSKPRRKVVRPQPAPAWPAQPSYFYNRPLAPSPYFRGY